MQRWPFTPKTRSQTLKILLLVLLLSAIMLLAYFGDPVAENEAEAAATRA